ncbi:MAG: thiamine pyrophosphate-dependent enzyme [Bacteroidota bacterium]
MLDPEIQLRAYRHMALLSAMASKYEANRSICKYVHATARGHEAIQLATAYQLRPSDYASPYYREDCFLLGLGFTPYELMLQLLAKGDDPFTGGREYYSHPNFRAADKPTIIHQSSATGMQVIPTTGIAHGLRYWEVQDPGHPVLQDKPVVICSLGDASVTEGEVSEAWQTAVLHRLPILYLVQDNQWGISVTSQESRAMNAFEYAAGFKGMHRVQVDGSDFEASYRVMQDAVQYVRQQRAPILVHASVPLLGHHTSGVRKEIYRDESDLEKHHAHDPFVKWHKKLIASGVSESELEQIRTEAEWLIEQDFDRAVAADEPDPQTVSEHVFAPTPITQEQGERSPDGAAKVILVDAALFAIREIMQKHPEAVLYGQDVGKRLGGVFREAATLGDQFGDHRVFNTAIQEAYIVGSTVGMAAVGIRPIVEVQFADYIYPGLNQLVTELSKSCYLSMGKFPVPMILRVPTGAYGGGGPYHSGSIESTLLSIKGIKVAYPSNASDMKGLMKAAYYDPNPVIMLEHKGLYWSKVPGTEEARTVEPDADYLLPLGKANIVLHAEEEYLDAGDTLLVITYGMGVYWAKEAAMEFPGQIEVIDLRTLAPVDEDLLIARIRLHGKCLMLTEEPVTHSFLQSLAGKLTTHCFSSLDAPIQVMGALDLPAVPMNMGLEKAMLPSAQKVAERIDQLLND